ncbi:MAG TPA: PVC-type heme-binding CxxCH protein [Pirellulales bacterium]|nr:PVC-type heme-binding CxxCH protein [Pirellulales bacterium]
MKFVTFSLAVLVISAGATAHADQPADPPRVSDPRLEIVSFAQAPDIRHPINLDFDRRGRMLVIESHTHFRPAQYDGPEHDRIRMLEDTDGDGRADGFGTFFEGTTFTMDLAVHHDGSVYVATRSEIMRLVDADDDGVADQPQPIVRLETKGDYPHNGLSGLAFDFDGNLLFGLGENLGASYRLVGSDGAALVGEGEGGNIFACTADGKQLRQVATGFWNPFGVTVDVFGRMWAIDNDPDAMPPCRLLHVVEGGDYGYQFRYGRSGRHPFQAWNGQLPGTLPMAAGTGEAPCEVLSYESDGLPAEYLGKLLVTSWADHRVEQYSLKPRGSSYEAERHPFVQGGSEFRPVGLAVAPDGSLFVSDWVRSDYTLHNQGAIWQIRPRLPAGRSRADDPRQALKSGHRLLREAAARRLKDQDDASRRLLQESLGDGEVRVRATAVSALAGVPAARDDLKKLAEHDPDDALRAYAVQALVAQGESMPDWLEAKQPAAVRLAAVESLSKPADAPRLIELLEADDPFLRSAAARELARLPQALESIDVSDLPSRTRMGLLLAQRAAGSDEAAVVNRWLSDPDEEVRFLAVKWIADRRLSEVRPQVAAVLAGSSLTVRMYQAYATALSRIDGREVSDASLAEHFVSLAADEQAPAVRRLAALRLVPSTNERLTIDLLSRLANHADASLQLEAVRALAEHPKGERFAVLEEIARDASRSDELRAEALVGLAARSPAPISLLMDLALGERPGLRDEALRALTRESLTEDQRRAVAELARQHPEAATLAARVLGEPAGQRPPHTNLEAWLQRLDGLADTAGPADAAAGRRVFFHPKLAGCFRCHRVDGRGREIGPDLSVIGRTERRHLLESILQPSNLVPPHYQVWQMELADGRTLAGMLVRTYLDEYTYVDPKGDLFQVRTTQIVDSRPAPQSIMPTGMVDQLTDRELRDLLAYLGERR